MRQAQFGGDGVQPLVPRPEQMRTQPGGCQQVHIHIAYAAPHQRVRVHKKQHFLVGGHLELGQRLQQSQHLGACSQVSAGQLPHHKWMHIHLPDLKCCRQLSFTMAQMVNPHGCVHQHHA